jgi:tetratricopeptide (TPR) repeat protein
MSDNQINISSVGDTKIAKYSSDNIKKGLSLAKKLSHLDHEQGAISDFAKLLEIIEIAQKDFDVTDTAKLTEKICEAKFDFNDFLKQMQMLKNIGSLGGLLKTIPGMGKLSDAQIKQGEDHLKKAEIMIASMMEEERADPDLLAGSIIRQQRVAEDSGYGEKDVRKFIAEFVRMRSMMQQMSMGNFPGSNDEASINSGRDAEYYYDLGMEKHELEDYQGAIDDFTQSIRLDPDYAIAYYWRAAAKDALEDYQGAIDDFTQSIRLDPDYAIAYYWRAAAKDALEDYQGAIDDFTQSIRLDPDDGYAYSCRADAKYKLEDYQGAIDDYTQRIKLDPDDGYVFYERADAKYKLGDYQGATDDYTQSIKLDPDDNYWAYSSRANAKKELGYYQDAIDDYDLAIYKRKEKGESFQSLLQLRNQLCNEL